MLRIAGFLLLFLACASITLASSPDAWLAFSNEVGSGCATSVKDKLDSYVITVDPFGSESYGVAIAEGVVKGGKEKERYVCIFNKKTKKTELSSAVSSFEKKNQPGFPR